MGNLSGRRIAALGIGLTGSVLEAVPIAMRFGWPFVIAGCILCFAMGAAAGVLRGSHPREPAIVFDEAADGSA